MRSAPLGAERGWSANDGSAWFSANTIFQQACKLGLEGIVPKRLSAPYRSGPSRDWIKVKIQTARRWCDTGRNAGRSAMDEIDAFLDECRRSMDSKPFRCRSARKTEAPPKRGQREHREDNGLRAPDFDVLKLLAEVPTPDLHRAPAPTVRDRFYIGEVVFEGELCPAEHPPILDRDLFEAVKRKLAERSNGYRAARASCEALFISLIFDNGGNRRSPSHTKGAARHRYYVSSALIQGRPQAAGSVARVPAAKVEATIVKAIRGQIGPDAPADDTEMMTTCVRRIEVRRTLKQCLSLALPTQSCAIPVSCRVRNSL
jgi:hypothetical protein